VRLCIEDSAALCDIRRPGAEGLSLLWCQRDRGAAWVHVHLRALNPHLVPLIAHDRARFGAD
jgi:hypothetical protein